MFCIYMFLYIQYINYHGRFLKVSLRVIRNKSKTKKGPKFNFKNKLPSQNVILCIFQKI